METIKAPKKTSKKQIAQTKKDIIEVFSHSTFGAQCLTIFATLILLKERDIIQTARLKELEKDMRSLNSHIKMLNDKLMQKSNEISDLRLSLKAKLKK